MEGFVYNKSIFYISGVLLIILLSISYRFALVHNIAAHDISSVTENDTGRYEKPALNYLENGTFAINPQDVDTRTIRNAPGYAFFIAANYHLFGIDRHKLVKTQVVVSSFTILIIALSAYLLWSWKVSIIAALLMAIDQLQILYSHVMLSETLFLFFMSLIILLAILMFKSKQKIYIWAILLAVAIAFSTYVHAVNYYLVVPIVTAMVLLKGTIQWQWKRLIIVVSLISLTVVLILAPWQIRNGQLTGVYMFSDNSCTTLLNYKASSVYVETEDLTIEEAVHRVRGQLPEEFSSLGERYDAEQKLALDIISDNFGAFSRCIDPGDHRLMEFDKLHRARQLMNSLLKGEHSHESS